jgi:hypothetical protein
VGCRPLGAAQGCNDENHEENEDDGSDSDVHGDVPFVRRRRIGRAPVKFALFLVNAWDTRHFAG